MPEGSVNSRGAQKSALAGVLYDKRTDAELGQLLAQLRGAQGLSPVQAAVVREASRCAESGSHSLCVCVCVGLGAWDCSCEHSWSL